MRSRIAILMCGCTLLACSSGGSGDGNDGGLATDSAAGGDGGVTTDGGSPSSTDGGALPRILFVGDSFTHGRYTPVRTYHAGGAPDAAAGSALVIDENFGQTGARAELEPGPWGGIPGIFAELAEESGLAWEAHIEAISETSLAKNYAAASAVIDQPGWNAVVLQELSTRPLPESLSGDSTSDPASFCTSVQTIAQGVHAAAPAAALYLYETWARADLAKMLSGSYASNLTLLTNAYHDAYLAAAAHENLVTAVAPAGDAWSRAWAEGVADPDPYTPTSSLPSLWYGLDATNDPAISSPDELHPSVYGAYLSGLVLFQQITGRDVRSFGAAERVAMELGIASGVATQLQQVAWEAVTEKSTVPVDAGVDPCTSQ